MSDGDVLELGEDGSFDVAPTRPVRQREVALIDYDNYNWSEPVQEHQTLFEALQPNEYTVYRGEKDYVVVLRLPVGGSLKDVSYSATELKVSLADRPEAVRIDLPDKVSITDGSLECKHCGDLVTIKFASK